MIISSPYANVSYLMVYACWKLLMLYNYWNFCLQTSSTSDGYGIPEGSSQRSIVDDSQRSSVTAEPVNAQQHRKRPP